MVSLVRRSGCALLVGALVAAPSSIRAHDAEHTAVSFTFARDGTFVLDVANDPNWLLLRLESFVAMEGGAPAPSASAGRPTDVERDARLRSLASVFIDRVVIWVDGREVRPDAAEYVPPVAQTAADSLPRLASYRLRGRVAPDVRTMRWYYGMVADAYPLSVARADGRVDKEWIVAGDAWSRTLDLAGQFQAPSRRDVAREYLGLGYRRVLPRGAGFVLFMLGLFLLRLEPIAIARQVAAFTAAHVIALWLVASSALMIPARPLGALLALSVVYVAIENLATRELKPWRMALVSGFGLAHGASLAQTFAGAPAPAGQGLLPLLAFTIGIESASLTVLALAAAGGLALSTRSRQSMA
jgi:hypothetical protein